MDQFHFLEDVDTENIGVEPEPIMQESDQEDENDNNVISEQEVMIEDPVMNKYQSLFDEDLDYNPVVSTPRQQSSSSANSEPTLWAIHHHQREPVKTVSECSMLSQKRSASPGTTDLLLPSKISNFNNSALQSIPRQFGPGQLNDILLDQVPIDLDMEKFLKEFTESLEDEDIRKTWFAPNILGIQPSTFSSILRPKNWSEYKVRGRRNITMMYNWVHNLNKEERMSLNRLSEEDIEVLMGRQQSTHQGPIQFPNPSVFTQEQKKQIDDFLLRNGPNPSPKSIRKLSKEIGIDSGKVKNYCLNAKNQKKD